MTQESIQPFLDWIALHPTWSGFIVFLISLSESLAVVGLMVPGIVMMTAIGGMMGAGILPFWETLTWAILGAIVGDGISYWLGYHYHEHLRDFWPFKQFPGLFARGEKFFRQHGGKSIVFGRFVGPVRPMIPVIAGMMDMPPNRFLFFNVLSAIAWAPLYSLPGILIGASLGSLSPEVARRAGLLVLLFLFALWLIYEFIVLIGFWIGKFIQRSLRRTWKSFQSSGRFTFIHSALKPIQGTEEGQLGLVFLFLFTAISFGIILLDVLDSEGMSNWNEEVYQIFRALYSEKIISFATWITGFGDPKVLLPAVLVIGIWLFWKQHFKTALFWLLTIGSGFLMGDVVKILSAIPRPEGLMHYTEELSFPSGHVLTATLVYGSAAVLIHHILSQKHRWIPWAISVSLIFVIGLSRLYLGVHWFTDILGGLTLAALFVTLGAFFYRRLEARPIPLSAILIPGVLTLCLTMFFYTVKTYPILRQALVREWPTYTLIQSDWWQGKEGSEELYRTGAVKHQATIFDVQWLDRLNSIEKLLLQVGFEPVPELNFTNSVMLLANHPATTSFPVMPKFHRDRLPVLVMTKKLNETKRVVLQLWHSDYETRDKIPLWVGTVRIEEEEHPLPLVTLYLESTINDNNIAMLTDTLRSKRNVKLRIIKTKDGNHQILLLRPS